MGRTAYRGDGGLGLCFAMLLAFVVLGSVALWRSPHQADSGDAVNPSTFLVAPLGSYRGALETTYPRRALAQLKKGDMLSGEGGSSRKDGGQRKARVGNKAEADDQLREKLLKEIGSSWEIDGLGTDVALKPVSDPQESTRIYYDASALIATHAEMEEKFKVYVYKDGDEPLVHTGPCKQIYAIDGLFQNELQRETNKFVTKDPARADLFFVPYNPTNAVDLLFEPGSHSYAPMVEFVKDYISHIQSQHPYFNQSNGTDHFMLSCHDWSSYTTWAHKVFDINSIKVLCNANSSQNYHSQKDVSLPELTIPGGMYPLVFDGDPPAIRTLLAFFSGGDHGPIRPLLFQQWLNRNDSDMLIFKQTQVISLDENYIKLMERSKFCLCPAGYDVNSPRLVQSIYYGCVPVIVTDDFVLPFSEVLRWETFSVRLPVKDIPNMKKIIASIPLATYISMQAKLKHVRRHFIWNNPPQKYDIFHMVMHDLWVRKKRLLNNEIEYVYVPNAH
ncbi:hypothetical protein CBR_g11233 [Chara braunii]|uniref:Exostosin GT47 domain-containing protein n=1 Tax=Chara braunii TaxID=69332 RepID=A0A388KQH2_CHABU|nr:hypothetical protein CBR_g11233 [Chara braunii]|eukprot:GBG72304.1 hypothetical protein CBR_g11233 [Chara braunii]